MAITLKDFREAIQILPAPPVQHWHPAFLTASTHGHQCLNSQRELISSSPWVPQIKERIWHYEWTRDSSASQPYVGWTAVPSNADLLLWPLFKELHMQEGTPHYSTTVGQETFSLFPVHLLTATNKLAIPESDGLSSATQLDRALNHMLFHQLRCSSPCISDNTTLHSQVSFVNLHGHAKPTAFHIITGFILLVYTVFPRDPFPKFSLPYDDGQYHHEWRIQVYVNYLRI